MIIIALIIGWILDCYSGTTCLTLILVALLGS